MQGRSLKKGGGLPGAFAPSSVGSLLGFTSSRKKRVADDTHTSRTLAGIADTHASTTTTATTTTTTTTTTTSSDAAVDAATPHVASGDAHDSMFTNALTPAAAAASGVPVDAVPADNDGCHPHNGATVVVAPRVWEEHKDPSSGRS
jgi:hypothetical protein